MQKLHFLLCFWLLVGAIPTNAQTLRKLQIVDAQTEAPVVSASVLFAGLATGFISDTSGMIYIPTLSQTLTTFRVTSFGYQTWTGQLNDSFEIQIIRLEPADTELRAVVISGTLKEVSKDASPIPVEIYTPKYFQKNAAPNLFESLNLVNGVRPQLNCNVCGTGDIQINGMPGPYTMVTIDGMPIVSGLSTVYGLVGIPNGMIERIEVVGRYQFPLAGRELSLNASWNWHDQNSVYGTTTFLGKQ